MQHSNHYSFQRFQLNGGRGGRAITGPLGMIIALVMFVILLGMTIVGSLTFLLIRAVFKIAHTIGEGIANVLPSGKKTRPAANGRPAANPQAETDSSSPEAWPAGKQANAPAKTISLRKDSDGAWRSGE